MADIEIVARPVATAKRDSMYSPVVDAIINTLNTQQAVRIPLNGTTDHILRNRYFTNQRIKAAGKLHGSKVDDAMLFWMEPRA